MTAGRDTIFALSSGRPPSAIGIIRISGPHAGTTLRSMTGLDKLTARQARVAALRDPSGELLDRGLVLFFPGPGSATGEDVVELHLHGGRATVDAVLRFLGTAPGLRHAVPGEFTRRAFENGRIDLTEAEGLAELLAAETEVERKAALRLASGHLSRLIARWTATLLSISAAIEASIEFEHELDGETSSAEAIVAVRHLRSEILEYVEQPTVERLREGLRVLIAGPVNAGKSTLLNALVGRDAAITSPHAGTTRDLIEAPVQLRGLPVTFIDTAGLRDGAVEAVEAIGIERARGEIERADLVLWLGEAAERPEHPRVILVHGRSDLGAAGGDEAEFRLSGLTGEGVPALLAAVAGAAKQVLAGGEGALTRHQQAVLRQVCDLLACASDVKPIILLAEDVRLALRELDALTGGAGVEEMLDQLFGRFCIGK